MELVSSYISDEEMESHLNPTQEKSLKKNNEDQNSGEDSDTLDIVFEKTVPAAVRATLPSTVPATLPAAVRATLPSTVPATLPAAVPAAVPSQQPEPANDEIECICLDDSDSDTMEVSFPAGPSKSKASSPIKKEVSKKIDYLNLDSSDTDDEQEHIQSNVNNLLTSAAILNDIECGPSKSVPELGISVTLPFRTDDASSPGKKRPSSSSAAVASSHIDKNKSTSQPAIDISGDEICSQEDLSNKKVKSGPVTTDSGDVTVTSDDMSDAKIRIYRKDERIIAAYKQADKSRIPSILNKTITAHQKPVSSLSWCAAPHSHLFLSSSLDSTVKVWDIYSQDKPVQCLQFPLGVRAAKWSKDGEQIIAGGFGKQAHVIDVLSGKTHMTYKIHNYVSCIAIHPFIEDVILCGTQNAVLGFDLRVDSELPVRTFLSKCGEILDLAFLSKSEFASSASIVSRDSADRTIMVWDFNSGAIMSNQIFLERYTCPSLKLNPCDHSFIAQTNGDYIVSFSSQKPYKMNNRRYMGHKVSGFGVECDISPDGRFIASGDAKGDVYFYNYADTTVVNKLTVKPDVVTNKLKWHPALPGTLAVATYDGQIHLWK